MKELFCCIFYDRGVFFQTLHERVCPQVSLQADQKYWGIVILGHVHQKDIRIIKVRVWASLFCFRLVPGIWFPVAILRIITAPHLEYYS